MWTTIIESCTAGSSRQPWQECRHALDDEAKEGSAGVLVKYLDFEPTIALLMGS